ncbi:MAG: YCF48-related protein [Ignavibacteria bacterium]
MNSVCFVDGINGFAAGNFGTFVRTSDGGTSWTEPNESFADYYLYSVKFADQNTGWAVGYDDNISTSYILKTTNGGTNWNRQYSNSNKPLHSVFFTDQNSGWAVGHTGTIISTTNSGANWISYPSGTSANLESVFFVDNNTGWIAGQSGTILKTTNGGTNWNFNTSGTNYFLMSIFFIDSNTGWFAGDGGIMRKTTNSGADWTFIPTNTTTSLLSTFFTDSNTGWAVGGNGKIIKSTNGGQIWTDQSVGTNNYLSSVYFANNNNGWISGYGGVILKTTNAGVNWINQNSGSNNNLFSVFSFDGNVAWVVGEGATILRTSFGNQKKLELKTEIEGLYDPNTNLMTPDTIKVFLRGASTPYPVLDSSVSYPDSNGNATYYFNSISNNSGFYIQLKHRNSLETWSGSQLSFSNDQLNYDFTDNSFKAYGNNMKQEGSVWTLYSGDIIKNGFIDIGDLVAVSNDATELVSGYVNTDVNGDNYTDLNDILIVYGNSRDYIRMITPLFQP